ncbi:hypothetical protein pdam_00013104 [Pocillopora damicornis]|uniref:Protein SPEC3 n=1 Tax=Pocillopora damicornis TaxID=46731 RepID=A0A3M6TVZ3_POCDA|nr:hypothetical protein pdam_00013104 [Pocillopora damicornis]
MAPTSEDENQRTASKKHNVKPLLLTQNSLHVPSHVLLPRGSLFAHPYPESVHPFETHEQLSLAELRTQTIVGGNHLLDTSTSQRSTESNKQDHRNVKNSYGSRDEKITTSFVLRNLPVLPFKAAVVCLILNCIVPGAVTDGDNESQGRNTKENLPALGLNAPVLTGENNSQAASDLSAGLPQVKPLENGNYQRSFSLESSRVTPRSARVSSSSSATAGLYTPFPGFQIPNETIIPKEDPATVVKRKQTISAKDAIPVLPRPVAIVCLIFNILIPGSGTVISGLIAFFLTRKNIPLISRTSILFVNCFVGFMQLATIVFLMIGWFWSIAWGCAFVGFSGRCITYF